MRKRQTAKENFLNPIQRYQTISAGPMNMDLYVPSGRRWKMKHVTLERANSGAMDIVIKDLAPKSISIAKTIGTYLTYQFDNVVLRAGWHIIGSFGAAASGTMDLTILFEESDEF